MKHIYLLLFSLLAFASAQSLSVTITADKTVACPGGSVNLSATVTGASQPDSLLVYEWSYTGNGSLSNSDNDSTIFTMPDSGDVTIQIKVVDGNDSTTNEIMLKNAWLKVNLISQPDSLECNSNVLLIAYTYGSTWGQQGKFYHWSSSTQTSPVFISINRAGTYSLTVTNNSGCSVSDTIEVIYRNGVTNVVDFTYPEYICAYCLVTMTNTSEYHDGWNYNWDFQTVTGLWLNRNAVYTYINPGTYTVTLTMDSAGCRFSRTKIISVLPETSPYCTYPNGCSVGIEEDPADRLIQISPNPNTGRVSIHLQDIPLPVRAELYDLLGRKMNIFQITQSVQELDLSLVEDGIYFLLFHQNERTVLKRVVISR